MRSRAFGVYFTFLNISFIVMLWFGVARRVAAGAWLRKGGGRYGRQELVQGFFDVSAER